jgi:hypothetical protein
MTLRLSESHQGVSVEIIVQIESANCSHNLPALRTLFADDIDECELLDRVLGRVHNQLPPILRQVRHLAEASLEEMVSYKVRDLMPDNQVEPRREKPQV